MQKIVFGALAGLSATMAMTVAMRHLARLVAARNQYPLPPREITESILPERHEQQLRTDTLLAHFGYGAFTGAIFALLPARRGMRYGAAVWALSYLGWIPALGVLTPATCHPRERNLLMLAAHLAWGATLQAGLRELEVSARQAFSAGPLRDVHAAPGDGGHPR